GLESRKSKTRKWPDIKDPPLDAKIDFDFGEASPVEGDESAEDFAIYWDGSVITKETGDYEFIIETVNGARLHINDNKKPLIDAGVRSGDDTVFRQTIRLLGGRAYPLHLYFVKSKPEKTASIRLKWRPPNQAEEV